MRLARSLVTTVGVLCLLVGSPAGSAAGSSPAGRADPDGCPLDTWAIPQAMQVPSAASDPDPVTVDSSRADLSMVGPGRYVLCLDDGTVRHGEAGCWWSEDRTRIDSVRAEPVRIGGRERWFSLGADVAGSHLYVSGRGRGGYDSTRGGTLDVTTPLGRSGIATFADLPGSFRAPGTVSGRFGWRCGEAPPRRRGQTSGSLTFTLSGPLAGTFTTGVDCSWEDRPEGRFVASVSGWEHRVPLGDGRYVSMSLRLSPDAPEPSITVRSHVSDATRDLNEDWIDETSAFVLTRSEGDASGRARILALHPGDSGMDEDGPSLLDPTVVGGSVSWTCKGPPARVGYRYPWASRPTVPGSAMLTFEDAPIRAVGGAADCRAYPSEDPDVPDGVSVSYLFADLTISGHPARLFVDPSHRYVLMLLGPDGTPLGEYIAEPAGDDLNGSQSTDQGWESTGPITFHPGPTLSPPALFGATVPAPFLAAVTTDCPIPPATG